MDNNEKDIIEKDIVNDVFGNVEESYDVPVYEPMTNNTSIESVSEVPEVEDIPAIEDVEPVVPTYTVPTDNTLVNNEVTPTYTEEPKVEEVKAFEESAPVEPVEVSVESEETPILEDNTSNTEYNYDIKPEVEEAVEEVAPVPVEPNYDEPVPFAESEVSSGVEHPDAKVTLQRSEGENVAEVSAEDLKINLNDNASLKFVLIIGIIIFIAIMILPFTNLI